jgi:hypothetical protein
MRHWVLTPSCLSRSCFSRYMWTDNNHKKIYIVFLALLHNFFNWISHWCLNMYSPMDLRHTLQQNQLRGSQPLPRPITPFELYSSLKFPSDASAQIGSCIMYYKFKYTHQTWLRSNFPKFFSCSGWACMGRNISELIGSRVTYDVSLNNHY